MLLEDESSQEYCLPLSFTRHIALADCCRLVFAILHYAIRVPVHCFAVASQICPYGPGVTAENGEYLPLTHFTQLCWHALLIPAPSFCPRDDDHAVTSCPASVLVHIEAALLACAHSRLDAPALFLRIDYGHGCSSEMQAVFRYLENG